MYRKICTVALDSCLAAPQLGKKPEKPSDPLLLLLL